MHANGVSEDLIKTKKRNLAGLFFLVLFLMIVIPLLFGGEGNNKKEGEKQEPEKKEKGREEIVIIGKTKALYRFSDYYKGVVKVSVEGDAEFYAKGGEIKGIAPSGREWIDIPGEQIINPTEEKGVFTFTYPDSSDYPRSEWGWGVEVWQ